LQVLCNYLYYHVVITDELNKRRISGCTVHDMSGIKSVPSAFKNL